MSYWFHGTAEAEHLFRVQYYESQRPGLGGKYLDDFDQTIARICESPGRYKLVRSPDIRVEMFLTFPCSVIYREVNSNVQILAVAHHRQRPGYWLARL